MVGGGGSIISTCVGYCMYVCVLKTELPLLFGPCSLPFYTTIAFKSYTPMYSEMFLITYVISNEKH